MVKQRDDLYITVPSYFRCPISLDVMNSPVTLSTGITYDRSSIQQWLDSGHDTCPATMQLLPSKDLVPNLTLRRLILLWSHHLHLHLPFSSSSAAAPSRGRILAALADLQRDEQTSLSDILLFSEQSEENRKFLADCAHGLPETLLRILCSPGTRQTIAGLVVRVLEIILRRADDSEEGWMICAMRSDLRWLDAVCSVLRGGLPKESNIAAVRIVQYYSTAEESKVVVAEKEGLLHAILDQLCQSLSSKQPLDSSLTEACLSCLIDLSPLKRVKMKLIDLNLIGAISKLLSMGDLPVPSTEKALRLLEAVTSCRAGLDDGEFMETVAQKLLKVSREATETSVRIAWVVCWLFGETAAKEALARSNGVGKLLVVMQSECSPNVRRMCVDLVKVLRKCHNCGVYDKGDGRCWYSYDTKTTHIMPF